MTVEVENGNQSCPTTITLCIDTPLTLHPHTLTHTPQSLPAPVSRSPSLFRTHHSSQSQVRRGGGREGGRGCFDLVLVGEEIKRWMEELDGSMMVDSLTGRETCVFSLSNKSPFLLSPPLPAPPGGRSGGMP